MLVLNIHKKFSVSCNIYCEISCLLYFVNIIDADDLVTQGARASAGLVLGVEYSMVHMEGLHGQSVWTG